MRRLWAIVPAVVIGALGVFAWVLLSDDAERQIEPLPLEEIVESAPEPPSPEIEPMREPIPVEGSESLYSNAAVIERLGWSPTRVGFDVGSQEYTPAIEVDVDVDVIVTDADGVEHARESGELFPAFSHRSLGPDGSVVIGGSWSSRNGVEVRDGRCRIGMRGGARLHVRALVLGGSPALCDDAPIAVESGKRLVVRARWIENVPLRVFDATTGAELRSYTLQTRSPFLAHGDLDPEDDGFGIGGEVISVNDVSPFPIPPPPGAFAIDHSRSLWLGAPGRAWKRIEVDFAHPEEMRVSLAAPASLIVELEGELPMWKSNFFGAPNALVAQRAELPMLHVSERGRSGLEEDLFFTAMPAVLGSTRFDGLPPRELMVSVLFDRFGEIVLHEVATSLVAGKTTKVTLQVGPHPSLERAPLAGRVFAPKGWELADLTLSVAHFRTGQTNSDDSTAIPLSRMVVLHGRPGWLRWRAGDVEPGRYRLTIGSVGTTTEVDVGPAGCEDAELELPEPSQVTALVLDESGDEVTLNGRFGWALAWLVDGEAADELHRARSVSDDVGWFGPIIGFRDRAAIDRPQRPRAVVPAGLGTILLSDPEWLIASGGEHELEPGEQEIVVRVRRAPSLELRFMSGGAPVRRPAGSSGAAALDAVGHAGRSTWILPTEFGARLVASVAGRYRVRVPPIPGYAKVDPFEVELAAGKQMVHVVRLQPR